jgi:uncharacterized protein (TIGR02246 family)
MTEKATSIVAQAKQWASYYGPFTGGEQAAVLSVPLRIRAAWESNDADAFADVFIENGSLLLGDDQLDGREEIRAHMAEGFAGPYQGARVTEQPLEIQFLTPDVALAITQGGVVPAGDSELASEREERAMWVCVKGPDGWRLAAQQTSPLKG